jgi:hypothetical protein
MKQVIITAAQINVCMKVGMIGKKLITIQLNGLVCSDNFDTTPDLSQRIENRCVKMEERTPYFET